VAKKIEFAIGNRCVCGRPLKTKAAKAAHRQYCPQWKEYTEKVIKDPEVIKLVIERGISPASQLTNIGYNTLKRRMGELSPRGVVSG
jgi:hypothetical protein